MRTLRVPFVRVRPGDVLLNAEMRAIFRIETRPAPERGSGFYVISGTPLVAGERHAIVGHERDSVTIQRGGQS